jgi:hypothetical protein
MDDPISKYFILVKPNSYQKCFILVKPNSYLSVNLEVT